MREIKFKAYHKKIGYVCEVYELDFSLCECTVFLVNDVCHSFVDKIENFKLLQYTCLKDKNDKEIYEGDVLSDGDYILGYVAFDDGGISWLSGSFFLSEKSDDGKHYASDAAFEDEYKPENWKELEVIGNIYENPELLDTKG